MTTLDDVRCAGGERRRLVRASGELTGLDHVDVGPDGRHLYVHLLATPPQDLVPGNLRITWAPGARAVRVVHVGFGDEDGTDTDCLTVRLDRPGDHSCYRLELVEADARGRSTDVPLAEVDPRFAAAEFRFDVNCDSDLDCAPTPCAPRAAPDPTADPRYLAKDYATFRQLILDRLAVTVPGWQERHAADLQLTLVEILAYVGDHLSYHQDAVATEAYLQTARLRTSVRRHARLVDYPMHEGCNARTWVVLGTDTDVTLDPSGMAFLTAVTVNGLPLPTVVTEADLELVDTDYAWFEPTDKAPLHLRATHTEIALHTWGDSRCCLPAGSTSATLVDPVGDDGTSRQLTLAAGELLLLEEVLGPGTGVPGDADPAHRHVVRLTRVGPDDEQDPLTGTPLRRVWWDAADALPFPLCLSSTGQAPDCLPLEGISVARGNVLLADDGRTVTDPSSQVPTVSTQPPCADGCPDPPVLVPGAFRPALAGGPLTFRAAVPVGPAKGSLAQDPRAALPQLALLSAGDRSDPSEWVPRPDLLRSDPDDRHFVVEVDDDGVGRLRFGDDVLGRAPTAAEWFTPTYRVGNGPGGNIGAGSLAHIVVPSGPGGVTLTVDNPLPASGGTAPEPVDQVKAHAPYAFRNDLQRAVTAADYATLAQRDFPALVQRAAAELRWNGSWYEVRVAIDPLGREDTPVDLIAAVQARLERYRRIGHDLVVVPAAGVGIQIGVTVCIGAGRRRSDVLSAVQARLGNGLLPDGGLGMFHPDAVSFGALISVSGIVAAVVGVPGVDNAVVTELDRYGSADPTVLAAGVLRLGPAEVPRLDNDPTAPRNGLLSLAPFGGR